MSLILEEMERRFDGMFSALAAGDDVAPATRLRSEGMMEAAVLLGAAGSDEVDGLMEECYARATGQSVSAVFGDNWREFFPYPQIPAMGQRAPVYPSTRD